MSRKVNLDLDTDSLRVIDPNEKPENENESNDIIDPNQQKLDDTDVLVQPEQLNEEEILVNTEVDLIKNNDWIDDNQISLNEEQHVVRTNEFRINNFNFQKETPKVKRNHAKSVMIATLFVNLFFAIWLFVVCMIPPISSNGVGDITPIYSKNAQDSMLFNLTAVGYVNLILFMLPTFILNIVNLVLRTKNKEQYFANSKKSARVSFEFFRYLLMITIVVMSLNLLIPPLGAMGNSSYYSFMYYYQDLTKTVGWYVIIVLFSLSLSAYAITLLVLSLLQSNVLNFEKIKERNEAMKKFFDEVKKAKEQKKVNKAKKKEILAEEEQLLNNLQEVSEEEKSLISEEEFQARMKSNNEIRNKVKELQRQQEELRKYQSGFLKKKKQESINRRPLKPKKQEITIPDKELEEIFKNIDLD